MSENFTMEAKVTSPENSFDNDTQEDKRAVKLFSMLDKKKEQGRNSLKMHEEVIESKVDENKERNRLEGVREEFIPQREAEDRREIQNRDMAERYPNQEKDKEGKPVYEVYNKDGMKHLIKDAFIEAYAKKNKEILSQYARFAIDINGLKAVNDLAGHENGNKFLARIVEQLKTIKSELIAMGFEHVEVSHEGGDEFGVFVKSGKAILPETLKKTRDFISDSLKVNCDEFLSLKQIIDDGHVGKPPRNYRFKSSAGVGAVTLDEILSDSATEEFDKKIGAMARGQGITEEDLTGDDIRNLLMGIVLDKSDKMMTKHKREVKDEQLKPFERKLLLRNEEMRKMHDDFVFLDAYVKKLNLAIVARTKERDELSARLTLCQEGQKSA